MTVCVAYFFDISVLGEGVNDTMRMFVNEKLFLAGNNCDENVKQKKNVKKVLTILDKKIMLQETSILP